MAATGSSQSSRHPAIGRQRRISRQDRTGRLDSVDFRPGETCATFHGTQSMGCLGMVEFELKYVDAQSDRRGRVLYYYFRRGGRRWRLRGEPLSEGSWLNTAGFSLRRRLRQAADNGQPILLDHSGRWSRTILPRQNSARGRPTRRRCTGMCWSPWLRFTATNRWRCSSAVTSDNSATLAVRHPASRTWSSRSSDCSSATRWRQNIERTIPLSASSCPSWASTAHGATMSAPPSNRGGHRAQCSDEHTISQSTRVSVAATSRG